MTISKEPESYAAIDLGSNSFHMVVANYTDGRAIIVDRIKNMVRLAWGLDADNVLSDAAMDRAIACLEKFAQRIKPIPPENVRIVGTNTLRVAKNGLHFLQRANAILGRQIEIISGREEARLIYLGVANTMFNNSDYRLVVDIGGGSTELVIGKGIHTDTNESLFMGCVSTSKQFFSAGVITSKAIRKAKIAALQEIKNVEAEYRKHGWDKAIGTSGTIRTILDVINEQGWGKDSITYESLERLCKMLVKLGHVDKLRFDSLSATRQPVFVGGVVLLYAIFESLNIDKMDYSEGALREGLLYEQIGRRHDHDIRDKTVVHIAKRYGIDAQHAKRLEQTVVTLFDSLHEDWKLDRLNDLRMLCWAARLHEIGLAIAHNKYHKHGEYILENSDMPGFSGQEQKALSVLVRSHRYKFPLEIYNDNIDKEIRTKLIRLSIILRLAVLLNRGRELVDRSIVKITNKKNVINLEFKDGWLSKNQLTVADLRTETNYLVETNYRLKFNYDDQGA